MQPDFLSQYDPDNLKNIVLELQRRVDALSQSFVSANSADELVSNFGNLQYRALDSDGNLRMVMSANDLFDELGVHAHFVGLNASGGVEFYVSADDGTIVASEGGITIGVDGIVFENNLGTLWFKDSGGDFGAAIFGSSNDELTLNNYNAGKGILQKITLTDLTEATLTFREDPGNANVSQFDVSPQPSGSKISLGGEVVIWAKRDGKETVFNDGSYDIDHRWEGATDANLLKLDAGLDAAAFGGDAESGFKVKVHGNFKTTGTITGSNVSSDGWILQTATWGRSGNYTFDVSGDVTAIYRKGAKLRYKDGGAYEYGVVGSSSFAASTTTVNLIVNDDYAMAAATITDTYISYIENPEGWPDWFNYVNTIATSANGSMTYTSVTITTAKWRASGKTMFYVVQASGTTGGTANTQLQASPPVAVVDTRAYPGPCAVIDGTAAANVGTGGANGSSAVIFVRKFDSSNYGLGVARLMQIAGSYPF